MAQTKRQTGDLFNSFAEGRPDPTLSNKGSEVDKRAETKEKIPQGKSKQQKKGPSKTKTTQTRKRQGRPPRDVKTVKKYFDLRQDLNEYLIRKSEEEERSVTTLINRAIKEMMERDNDI